ncbi:MAG: hypothetical protein LBK66_14710 [Spirochaetaceae bacterium]|jgi:hypothetical protein|nr:hypothetical protein [Spirochaetaceae bacterium]
MKSYKIIGLTVALSITGLSLFAQDYQISSPPAPTETNLFNPESGLYRASMGTIRSDIDKFMDVGEFKETSFDKMLTYVGFEAQGITIGAGMKLGQLYFGIAYGGSLIQDLFSRATNQDPSEMSLKLDTQNGSSTEIPGVYNSDGGKPAEANNRNEFNIFLGLWRVGLKIGFSQSLTVTQPQGDSVSMEVGDSGAQGFAFENALVPSLAIGMSIPIKGKFFIVPEISAQMDIHQFVEGADPHYETVSGQNVPVFYSGYTQMYNEAKVGADLGLIIRSPKSEMRFGGGYYLKKRMLDFDINGGAEITHVVVDNGESFTIKSIYDNLEQEISPYFLYTGDIGERFKIGVKVLADIRINDYYMTPGDAIQLYGDYETHATEIYVRPELNFGGTFAILPDRFALHAGFGLNLHTFNISTSENKSLDQNNSSLEEILPSTRFAVGFTINLTKAVTIDMLLITSGKFDFKDDPDYNDISSLRKAVKDSDKFTFFLTMKK